MPMPTTNLMNTTESMGDVTMPTADLMKTKVNNEEINLSIPK
jgi:hypothetical protein